MTLAMFIFSALVFLAPHSKAEPVGVRHREGLTHGFLLLQTLEGTKLADGESTQTTRGDRVTSRLVLRFVDGSIYDNTTVFTQRGVFHLVSDHVIQRGPSFKQAMETTIDAASGQVTVKYTEDGKENVLMEHMDMPPDLVNGFVLTALKNLPSTVVSTTFSLIAASPKPRLIKLEIERQPPESFWSGSLRRDALHYRIKVDLKGVAGAVAPLIGKQPPDTHVWVMGGTAPTIVKTEGPLTGDGPVWRLISAGTPVFKNRVRAKAAKR